MSETLYAIIDGAIEERLLDFLSEHNPPHCCLYAEPLQQELVSLAPYLVEVTDKVSQWLGGKNTHWGIYLSAAVEMKDLRHHLRKYLQVMIPAEKKPVYFRFYDPRNIWDFCSVLSDWELHCFMGPMEKIRTVTNGVIREYDFKSIRKQFPDKSKSRAKIFKVSKPQIDTLNQIAEDNYLTELTGQILLQYPTLSKQTSDETHTVYMKSASAEAKIQPDMDVEKIVRDCYFFCKNKGIDDDRSIRGILHLLIQKEIYELDNFPETWLVNLNDTSLPGYYRVERLLKEQLGYIPG
ncbi:TPA: DUF4123 domain-containing protein [Klebsiella oxytoca]|uniref:DUF4123 domain-containing protein n=1 Tax=Klebsiella oxytoca TaxID=571 RepID=A0AAN5LA35_KLEOX|nr:DUF4123 domain-containing protein [Klebsiella oxytoca]